MHRALHAVWVFGLLALGACDSRRHELRLVMPASITDREIAEDLIVLLGEGSSIQITSVSEALPGEAAVDALAAGDADIALVSNNLPFRNDIATVMPLYPTVLHIARHRRIEAPAGPEIFHGATIYAGPEGSASRLVFERFIGRIGLNDDQFRYVSDSQDSPDVVILFAPITPERVAEFPEFLLESMGSPGDIGTGGVIDAAVMLNPQFRPFVIPVGTYGDATPTPIVTVAVDKILVARSDLDSAVVYDLINEILRHRPALAAKRPAIFQKLEDFDVSRSTYVVHTGTQAYLQRDAPSVYERYSGIAEVVVTVIVALGSATFASVRIFRMRRKNRIDRFYSQTIALRRSVNDSSSPDDVQNVVREIRDLQNKAFDLLVDEKLAADESFRIFVTLSNDALRQLGDTGPQLSLSDS